ncbi:MAG: LON peptidase substrate-binding domain-containing protein, partial [Chlorobi bacterium]|nr:LON peptidase substrate-binding domain-containing protein [Chlorobiota bacterium]
MAINEDILTSFEDDKNQELSVPKILTVLPLRDIVIYPYMIFPVLIGRTQSLKAVAEAVERDKFIFVTAQKDPSDEEPAFKDLYRYGTVAKIIQILRLPNNLLKVLVEGLFQAKILKSKKNDEFMETTYTTINVKYNDKDNELKALIRHTSDQFRAYVKESPNMTPDLVGAFDNIDDPNRKLYFAAANIRQDVEVKQRIMQKRTLKTQYLELATILSEEIDLLKIEDEIDSKINDSIQKTQKKYYIQEQIRALQDELGDEEDSTSELQEIRTAIDKAKMPKAVLKKAMEEFNKLKKTPTMSPDYSVNRTYLELLTDLPWYKRTTDDLDIEHVKQILDEDHWDLEKPKERILEFIAVLNMAGILKRQILCLAGPPGVGKTSLA